MSDKQLRIGLIGTGFMGRAHSNAYRKAPNFFDLGMEPVLQAVCARSDGAAVFHVVPSRAPASVHVGVTCDDCGMSPQPWGKVCEQHRGHAGLLLQHVTINLDELRA